MLDVPFSLTVSCRSSDGTRAIRHPVVIAADWSFETGHDAGLEQIAAALGAGVSCIPLLQRCVPGLRLWWQRQGRAGGPAIRSHDRGESWRSVDGALRCCPAQGFCEPHEAGAHARGTRHVALATGTDARELAGLLAGLDTQARAQPPPASWAADDPSLGALLQHAWDAGLHPRWVGDVLERGAALGPTSLDVTALLAIAQTGADPTWLALTAAASGAPDMALSAQGRQARHWLAWTWTDLDRRLPDARAQWLRSGTRRIDIEDLSAAGYPPRVAEDVARGWGISVPGAGQILARWVRAGYRPTPEHLLSTQEGGATFPPSPPAPSAVERVLRSLRRPGGRRRTAPARPGCSPTELAIALVRHGTVPDTVAALRRGPEPAGRR